MNPSLDETELLNIARAAGITPDEVRDWLAQEWEVLDQRSRVKAFLPLLALKHVRAHFLHGTGLGATAEIVEERAAEATPQRH